MSKILARARSQVGLGVGYSLGCGGWDPDSPKASETTTRKGERGEWCDCSGFVAWCVGLSRRRTICPGLWGVSTVSIHRDATTKGRFFCALGKAGGGRLPFDPQPGDLVVYPDRYDPKTRKTRQGHVAVLVDHTKRLIVDCSGSAGGITERVAGSWWNRCVVVRYVGPGSMPNDQPSGTQQST